MEQDRRERVEAAQRQREAAAKPAPTAEPVAPDVAAAAIDATMPARSADVRDGILLPRHRRRSSGAELSDDDQAPAADD